MPVEQLVTAVIETVLNRLIQDDPVLTRQLVRLKGQVIQLHVNEFNRTLTFVFAQQIDVLADYADTPDCYLSLSLSTLPELRQRDNITRLIKQDKLELRGDIQLAQKFADIVTEAKPDLEEWLSRLMGDVAAHSVVRTGSDLSRLTRKQLQKQQRRLLDVITEEWKLIPAPLEVAYFCDQVERLDEQVSLLEKRIKAIEETQ